MRNWRRRLMTAVAVVVASFLLSGCTPFWVHKASEFSQALRGVSGTMSTYDHTGSPIDRVHGKSFRITRDKKFDSVDAQGNSNGDSSVLYISLGENHISHVGSCLILAQDGLVDVTESLGSTKVAFSNTQPGRPFLNDLIQKFRDNWRGKARTILIRSQDGLPVAVFAGDSVVPFKTDVKKSTWFQVDNKMLFVYRCDYTVYDTALLANNS